jgi:hypothetical protein
MHSHSSHILSRFAYLPSFQATNLVRGPGHDKALNAYVKIRCGNETDIVPPVTSETDHHWTNRNIVEFHKANVSEWCTQPAAEWLGT